MEERLDSGGGGVSARHLSSVQGSTGTGSDVVAQIAAIDSFIQVGYDAIVFDAVNPKAFDSVIRRAKKAGTVLVSFDNVVDSPDVFKVTPDFNSDRSHNICSDFLPGFPGSIN